MKPRRTLPLHTRFWRHVLVSGPEDCWLWTASVDHQGYGRFHLSKRRITSASRASWLLEHGEEAPIGMDVCHTCDIRLCVNPAHLFLGTRSDNMRDALKKGRLDPRRGASNGNAALTSAAAACVLRRFSEGESLRSIARSMGVSATTCRGIASGLRYKEVQPPLKASAAASSETPA